MPSRATRYSYARLTLGNAGFQNSFMSDSGDDLTFALLSIKAETAIAQNCLQHAATATAHDHFTEANRRLANATRAYHSIVNEITKLPPNYDVRSHIAMARILKGEIDQLEKHILKNDRT